MDCPSTPADWRRANGGSDVASADGRVVYLISGPCGVGKSTVSRELARRLERAVLMAGDDLLRMVQGYEAPWEERLSLAWTNIVSLTRNFVHNEWNVVIDFVVEDELEWFCEQVADLPAALQYVVLRADEDALAARLTQRGDPGLADRSLFLLRKLEGSGANRPFLYDATRRQPAEIAEDILSASHLRLPRRRTGDGGADFGPI